MVDLEIAIDRSTQSNQPTDTRQIQYKAAAAASSSLPPTIMSFLLSGLDALLAQGSDFLRGKAQEHGALTVFLCGMMAAHEAAFLGANAFYYAASRLPALRRFKIQQDGQFDPSPEQVWRAIKHVYFGRLVFQLPATVGYHFLWRACGGTMTAPAPPASTVLAQLGALALLMEVTFYTLHRAFHHRSLYSKWHKQHHEFKAPVGVASEYAR
jgi:sterol desaturase/sphingolipid hydroxylase (fatty acid hydroxylase superfamily)